MRILVATHKLAELPEERMYLPIQVGHALRSLDLGLQCDDDGENISRLNDSYCELTALYWAWKNLDTDSIGLCHYRRYFSGTAPGPNKSRILSEAEAERVLRDHEVILARRRHYMVETIDSHYRHAHYGSDLDTLRDVVGELTPDYLATFDSVLRSRSISLYNMFLMRRALLDDYAAWLFPILFETTSRIGDCVERTSYQRRVAGFLGERLINVWVAHQRGLRVLHLRTVNTDGEARLRKAAQLLARKTGFVRAADRVS